MVSDAEGSEGKVLKMDGPLGGRSAARVHRVQKVQRVQRVVVAPFGRNHHTWRRTSPVVS